MPILLKKKSVLKFLDFLIHCVHSTSCLLGSHHFIIADKKKTKNITVLPNWASQLNMTNLDQSI